MKGLIICLILTVSCTRLYAQNYDEAKVPRYTLPALLKTADGRQVKDRATWEKKRRPEILNLFKKNVYGQMPKDYDSLKFTITHEVADAMAGKAHLREVTITVWRHQKSVAIRVTLFTPNSKKTPVPAFLLINNRDTTNTDPTRKVKSEFWPAETVIDSGYAIAAFQVNDAAPDNKDTYQHGVLQLYPEQITANDGMRAIGAWAWAASRVMDYFIKDQAIDAKRIAVVGHSRGGKAALWTGAVDQRFAMVFANCSGTTGASLARRKYGETVHRINDHFPYWFANNYHQYSDHEELLPVDQHMLIALIAPRPLYTTNASEDLWADPKGSYLSLLYGQKAYGLYHLKSTLPPNPPALETPIIQSILGYHIRKGIHNLTAYDWGNFIKFAKYHYAHKL